MSAPRRAAVLGSPIAHSLSPVLHRAAYEELGLTDWSYDRFEVDEAALPAFMERLDAGLGGAVADHAAQARRDPAARRDQRDRGLRGGGEHRRAHRGRARTRRQHRHPRHGRRPARARRASRSNPRRSSARAPPPPPRSPRSRGSAPARSIAYVRSEARAAEMRRLGRAARRRRCVPRPGRTPRRRSRAPLVIATTPAGTTDALAAAVPHGPAPSSTCCTSPGRPRWPPRWSAYGGAVVGGLDLLVHQAVLQVEQMTGRTPAPLAAMRTAGEAALAAR